MVDAYFDPMSLLPVLGPAIGMTIGLCLRYFIKKKSKDKGTGVAYVVLTILSVIFLSAIANSLLTNRPYQENYRIDPLPEGVPLVTMEELVESSRQGRMTIREFDRGMSPVTPLHYDYWETKELEGESQGVRVRYYNTIHPAFAQMIFQGITGDLSRGIKFRGEYYLTKTIITDDEMQEAWQMDHLALTEERDELILHRRNTVVHVSGDLDFDDTQIRDLIVEELF